VKKPTSKDRRHAARKALAMRKGQVAAIVPGRGINPLAFVNLKSGLIRVTTAGILEYAR
jgi:hypothetical protein